MCAIIAWRTSWPAGFELMAHSITITDGTDTINLHGTDTITLNYTPVAPEVEEQKKSSLVDGGDLTAVNLRNPTETIELLLQAASKTLLQSRIRSIEQMMFAANRRQRTKTGPKIYLQIQVDGESDTWRSEIISGRLVLDDHGLDMWANIKVKLSLHITRRYYWEGSEVELELSTSNASAATGGQTIYNYDDSGTGHDNWVEIADDQVEGTLPAPVKVTLQNTTGSAAAYWNFYLSVNAYADPGNFVHILEGEDAASGATSTDADAGCSNGYKATKSWSGDSSLTWTLTAAQLQRTNGRFFRVLARFEDIGGPFYATLQVRDNLVGSLILFEGDEVLIDTPVAELKELGSVPLPPSNAVGVSWASAVLYLKLRASASTTFELDFLQLTPTDSYIHCIQLGYSVPDDGIITIDSIDEAVHYAGNPIYTPIGLPLLLYPGRTQRIIVLIDKNTFTPDLDNTFLIQAYYRPRRSTL